MYVTDKHWFDFDVYPFFDNKKIIIFKFEMCEYEASYSCLMLCLNKIVPYDNPTRHSGEVPHQSKHICLIPLFFCHILLKSNERCKGNTSSEFMAICSLFVCMFLIRGDRRRRMRWLWPPGFLLPPFLPVWTKDLLLSSSLETSILYVFMKLHVAAYCLCLVIHQTICHCPSEYSQL